MSRGCPLLGWGWADQGAAHLSFPRGPDVALAFLGAQHLRLLLAAKVGVIQESRGCECQVQMGDFIFLVLTLKCSQ